MTNLDFIIFSLTTYRLTRLMTTDVIFSAARDWIWNKFPPETSKIGYVFTCNWCSSIWAGLTIVTWYTINAETIRFFGLVLALSAIAGLLTAHEDKG